MTQRITEKQAEKVCGIVAKAFAAEPQYGPKVIMDWDYGPAIVWEEGPYGWAITFASMAAGYETVCQEFGYKRKPVKIPAGIFVEPATSYAISMYPEI